MIVLEYINTISNATGSDKEGDKIVSTPIEALVLLHQLIEETKQNTVKESELKKWDFATSPHVHFNKTLDDTFMAFIMWARVKDDESSMINVSKAFRRLETYANWMHNSSIDLVDPLTPASIQKGLEQWCMNSSYDKDGRFLWWCDMSRIDMPYMKKELTPEESLRAFVWYAHAVMYDEKAQKNGLVFIYNVNRIGMIATFTLTPAKFAAKLDCLTIGVLPIKMKGIYMLDSPTWLRLFMGLMSIFMSKKMKERIVNVKEWKTIEETFGAETIPKMFGKLEGKLQEDVLEKEYFS